jgi:hypothetical protein
MRRAAVQVLAPHDGAWWPADVFDQYRSRSDGHWQVVVRFTTEPGWTYVLAMPAERCRALTTPRDGTGPDVAAVADANVVRCFVKDPGPRQARSTRATFGLVDAWGRHWAAANNVGE